ncbi:MAG: thermonuclease family protein [Methylococcales bacterium]|nr:thermonuclease family protein [Methylococcales bacterium]
MTKLLAVAMILLFTTTACATVYKCGNVYTQSPCGTNSEIVEFENQPKQSTSLPKIPLSQVPSSNVKTLKTIEGKVIRVADGDTITVKSYQGKEKIRFAQIDAPETTHFGSAAQPYGKESAAFLRSLVSNKNVRVDVETVDQYGRNVGTVFVDGINVNREMVKNGYAWVYRQYAHDESLLELEKSARANRIGLWTLDNSIYPPDFRKKNK